MLLRFIYTITFIVFTIPLLKAQDPRDILIPPPEKRDNRQYPSVPKLNFLFIKDSISTINLDTTKLPTRELRYKDFSPWKEFGYIQFQFQNIGLQNWAEGGQGAISAGTTFNLNVDRETKKSRWKNNFRFDYGIFRQGGRGSEFRKADDRILLSTQYSAKMGKKWSFSGSLRFNTQITRGFKFSPDPNNPGEENQEKISDFLAPGQLQAASGLEYNVESKNKKTKFSALLSPTTGKLTIVLDDSLSAAGAFGVAKGRKLRSELGVNIHSTFHTEFMKNMTFENVLNLFANYLTLNTIDVNWETNLVMKVNKNFNTKFSTRLIYDEDINIKRDDGTTGPATQFRHILNVGIIFNF